MPAGLETRDTADLEVCATSRRFGIHHRTYGLDHLAWAGEGDGQQRREDSWKDAFALEYQPSQSCQTEVGTRWRHRRAADIPTGAQENSFGTPSEHLRNTFGAIPCPLRSISRAPGSLPAHTSRLSSAFAAPILRSTHEQAASTMPTVPTVGSPRGGSCKNWPPPK